MLKILDFYLFKHKSFIPKKSIKCTMYHEHIFFQPTDGALTFLIKDFVIDEKEIVVH